MFPRKTPAHHVLLRSAGFTLIELIIVIAVIAIITAVAIPNILSARKASNEASATASLRTVISVNERYKVHFATYASSFTDLTGGGFLDEELGSGSKAGYSFNYSGSKNAYSCTANPQSAGSSGERYFFTDHSGVIRFSSTATATSASTPIGQ